MGFSGWLRLTVVLAAGALALAFGFERWHARQDVLPGPSETVPVATAPLEVAAPRETGPRGAGASRDAAPGRVVAPGETAPPEPLVPFRVGEQLEYRVGYANLLTAATAHLAVTERRGFFRWQAWHFQAAAHTVDPLRLLFALDDQFDSYTDTATLASRQYEQHLREQGKQTTRILRLWAQGDPSWGDGPLVIVLPGTRDPLAALYYLRTVAWQRTPDVRVPVHDGAKLYEMRAHLEAAQAPVSVPAGNYTAERIAVRVFQNGQELSQTSFSVWLARDPARTPVLIEGVAPFGTVRGELLKAVQ